ncbi:septum site-determining protein MinC [Gracilibacillus salitolerans]|uniref:Probable septum site-determining protein MinC n=1 Tax=Gracilibacillus salitolerans TaxID=2663022 RepID=A0A5Q2TMA0_9BACI|nr:septum site-determining protein MinC [Gracilibacillus salitolerans]QGH35113.1 septum site-determining protein MinC [Gracilibacillus salitolerans]
MASNKWITIKGTRDGLTLFMNDQCAWNMLLEELGEILTTKHMAADEPLITVKIELGNRYITNQQEQTLREVIRKHNKLVVDQIASNVILKEEALQWKKETDVNLHNKIVRSGQVLEINGDLLLVGDVNPGGRIVATGNIFVMGSLRGIAHAGADGNRDAVIAAAHMAPSQLRIAEVISRSPDADSEGAPMECGFIDSRSEQIVMDRISTIARSRPELNAFERRVMNG